MRFKLAHLALWEFPNKHTLRYAILSPPVTDEWIEKWSRLFRLASRSYEAKAQMWTVATSYQETFWKEVPGMMPNRCEPCWKKDPCDIWSVINEINWKGLHGHQADWKREAEWKNHGQYKRWERERQNRQDRQERWSANNNYQQQQQQQRSQQQHYDKQQLYDLLRNKYKRHVVAAKVLGIDLPTSASVIEEAYRQAARKHHPDLGGIHEDMVAVNVAREVLMGMYG